MQRIRRENLFSANLIRLGMTAALSIALAAYAQEPSASLGDSELRSSETPAIPSIIFRQGGKDDYPIWVEASVAFDEMGRPNPAFFFEQSAIMIESFLQIEPDPKTRCIQLENFYVDRIETPDRHNLGEIVKTSELIMIGRVIESAPGFVYSTPSTLYAIEKYEVLKGSTDRDRFFVPFPRAEFNVAGHRICKSDNRYAESPKIGDSVLVLLHRYPDPSESFLNPHYETSLMTLDTDGAAHLPRRLREKIRSHKSSAPIDRGDLVDQINALISNEGS